MSQANRPRRVIQTVVVNVPNGSNIFSNLVGICCLKLRQLRVPLDFKEDFLPGGRQNLQIQRRRRERREIEADFLAFIGQIVPLACRKEGRTLMLIVGALGSSCLGTDPWVCSFSDMMRKVISGCGRV